jgi:hypothetical protein
MDGTPSPPYLLKAFIFNDLADMTFFKFVIPKGL